MQDDANNDPQYSDEQMLAAEFEIAGQVIGQVEVDIMKQMALTVFEVLEKIWAKLGCALVDMKIEFGVDVQTGTTKILLPMIRCIRPKLVILDQ